MEISWTEPSASACFPVKDIDLDRSDALHGVPPAVVAPYKAAVTAATAPLSRREATLADAKGRSQPAVSPLPAGPPGTLRRTRTLRAPSPLAQRVTVADT